MILCGLHEHPQSSAAVAYAVWLGQQLHMPLWLCPAEPRNELLAAAEAHRARLLVVAGGDSDSVDSVLSLAQDSPRPVIALSRRATAQWREPHRAQASARSLIVAGVDGSEASLAAAAEAADLTERMDSWLILVQAQPVPVPHGATWLSADDPHDEADDSARRALAQCVLPTLGPEDGESCVRSVRGDPVEVLDATASAEAAAMIAVGSRGLGRDRRAHGGSVSAADQRCLTPCPRPFTEGGCPSDRPAERAPRPTPVCI